MTAFIANTNILDLIGLKSEVENLFIDNATVTVTVKDQSGSEVAGVVWPVTMDYVAASNGNYRATLSHLIAFQNKKNYRAFIEVDAGVGRIGHWEFPFKPEIRTGVVEA